MPGKDSDKGRGPPTNLPERKELSSTLQKLGDRMDKEESFYDELYDGRYVIGI